MDRNQERYYTTKPNHPHKDSTARTWQVDRSTSDDINRLAAELECYPSDLVNMLLARAIKALESGQWSIDRLPIKYLLIWGQEASSQTQTGTKRD